MSVEDSEWRFEVEKVIFHFAGVDPVGVYGEGIWRGFWQVDDVVMRFEPSTAAGCLKERRVGADARFVHDE